jgi:hypothetical protein
MNYLKEKVAYLKGLADGMQISDATNEGKLLKAIIDVLEDVAISVDDVEEVQEQLSEQMDEMDEDLAEIERLVFDDECDCEECEDDDDGEDDDEVNEFDCPNCGESIVLEEAFINKDSILCPHCHKEIEIEWTCDCEECEDCEDETEN